MVEHEPVFGLDKEVGCAAKPVIEVWIKAYKKNPNREGLDEAEKQAIKKYLDSLDPEVRQALTKKGPDGKSILSKAPQIAQNQARLRKAA